MNYAQPPYRTGPLFLSMDVPNSNSLASGIVGETTGHISGTDSPDYVRQTIQEHLGDSETNVGILPKLPDMAKVGRAIAWSLVALLVVAFGLWVLIKQ